MLPLGDVSRVVSGIPDYSNLIGKTSRADVYRVSDAA